jgi:hypothetical protein
MSLQRFKPKVGEKATYTDAETGFEHRNVEVLEVHRSKALVRNSYGFCVEVPRKLLRAPEPGDASMITSRVSAGPKRKPPAKVFHVR